MGCASSQNDKVMVDQEQHSELLALLKQLKSQQANGQVINIDQGK